jgi:hypothetical protein
VPFFRTLIVSGMVASVVSGQTSHCLGTPPGGNKGVRKDRISQSCGLGLGAELEFQRD